MIRWLSTSPKDNTRPPSHFDPRALWNTQRHRLNSAPMAPEGNVVRFIDFGKSNADGRLLTSGS